MNELLKLMSVLTKDSRFEEVLNEEGCAPDTMCKVLDRAEARGEERFILGAVDILRDLGISNNEIIDRIQEKYNLTQAEAEAYVLASA